MRSIETIKEGKRLGLLDKERERSPLFYRLLDEPGADECKVRNDRLKARQEANRPW